MHRAAVAEAAEVIYKEGRKPMPDLLREQFPHFRPIVEALGYRNLEFEGWEADDVIATLATRADTQGSRRASSRPTATRSSSAATNVCLMMTPRGVADVNVYTPDASRHGTASRPEQVPDFIGLKGDTSDNIPGVPGIGDKTAGQLVAQYGSLEAVIEHADELSPARRKNITEHADIARTSKELATMRRDLDIDCDPAQLVLDRPTAPSSRRSSAASSSAALLNRVDELDAAVPSAPMKVTGIEVPWREGALDFRGVVGYAAIADRVRWQRRRRRDRSAIADPRRSPARRARREGAAGRREGGHAPRRVPDRSRAARRTSSTTSPPNTASSCCRRPRPTRRRRRSCAMPRRRAG